MEQTAKWGEPTTRPPTTHVGTPQAIDRASMNPLFMLTFMGALVFTGAARLLYLRGDGHSVLA